MYLLVIFYYMDPLDTQPQPPITTVPVEPSNAKWIVLGVIVIIIGISGIIFAQRKNMVHQNSENIKAEEVVAGNPEKEEWVEYTPGAEAIQEIRSAVHKRMAAFQSNDPEQFKAFMREVILAHPRIPQEEKDKILSEQAVVSKEEAESQAKFWSAGLGSAEKLKTLPENFLLSEKEKVLYYKKRDTLSLVLSFEDDDSVLAKQVFMEYVKTGDGKIVILDIKTN